MRLNLKYTFLFLPSSGFHLPPYLLLSLKNVFTSNLAKYIVVFAFCIPIFYGCKKDNPYGDTFVEGVVIDKTDGVTVPNAEIFLYKDTIDNSFTWLPTTQPVTKVFADQNGNFKIHYLKEKQFSYFVFGAHELYFDNHNDYNTVSEKEQIVEIKLHPEAWLKVILLNINPFNDYDSIYLDPYGYGLSVSSGGYFYGAKVDTSTMARLRSREVELIWKVTKNGVRIKYSQRIFCPKFDTTYYKIEY